MAEAVSVLSTFISAVAALKLHVVENAGAIFASALPDRGGYAADTDNLLWFVGVVSHNFLLYSVKGYTHCSPIGNKAAAARTFLQGWQSHATCPCGKARSG